MLEMSRIWIVYIFIIYLQEVLIFIVTTPWATVKAPKQYYVKIFFKFA